MRGGAGGSAGGVGAGGDGNLGADLERGALAVGGADAGVLQDARVGVGEQRVHRAAGDGDGEVGGVQIAERVQREAGGGRAVEVVPVLVPVVEVEFVLLAWPAA